MLFVDMLLEYVTEALASTVQLENSPPHIEHCENLLGVATLDILGIPDNIGKENRNEVVVLGVRSKIATPDVIICISREQGSHRSGKNAIATRFV